MEALKKVPPNNQEAEKSVLGCMILDSAAVAVAVEILSPADFYSPSNREIFSASCALYEQGKPVDIITLLDELKRRGTVQSIGGVEYLVELSTYVPSTANAAHYIKIVEEHSILRRLIQAGGEIIKEAHSTANDVNEALDKAEKKIFDIAMRKNSDSLRHIRDALTNSYASISEAMSKKGGITGLSTGFSRLDYMTSGLHPSELIVIAGRPGMGKTSFAVNIAQHVAVKEKLPVAIFSLEMSREQLSTRLLCSQALIDMQKVRKGELNDEELTRIAREGLQVLSNAPIFIDDTPAISMIEIRSKCRRLKMDKGLSLVVVDYLQLMPGSGRNENRQQEISELTRQMKGLARELQTPVLLLSQLSRAAEKRPDHRPVLSDLRESGSIEQDADIVLFIYRNSEEGDNIAEAILSKQRNGPTGSIPLVWLGQYTRFVSLEKDRTEV